MVRIRAARWICSGLQMKAILVLAVLVAGVALAGGWFYFASTEAMLRTANLERAQHIGKALSLAAEPGLRARRYVALDRLVREQVGKDDVVYIAVLNENGNAVASAGDGDQAERWAGMAEIPLSMASLARSGDDHLLLARPVISREAVFWADRIAGAVRLVVDTRSTAARLAGARRRIGVVAGAIILCGVPLGYVLVWRLMVRPVHRLVAVTRRLADGDFLARSEMRSHDEIGTLAQAFDTMADEVASMRDELIEANEQLEQKVADRTGELEVANRRLRDEMGEKEDFLRAVSHDLNAPLRNIAGMATMIVMKWREELPEEVLARLQRIQGNVDVETSLIGELLELSRIRSRPQKRQVVDLGELLAGLARTFEYELKSRNIELRIADTMPGLYVEKSRIRQLFQNLIDNAVKYMDKPHGGCIAVGYERDDEYHRFSVADNGPGIAPDQQEKIFHVFRRAETPAACKVESKGVGLAVVRSVVANYDGRVWVKSEPSKGATFYVALGADNTEPPREAGDETPTAEVRQPEARREHHPVG